MLIFFNEFRKISTVSSSCIKIQVLYVICDEGRKGKEGEREGRSGEGRRKRKGERKKKTIIALLANHKDTKLILIT